MVSNGPADQPQATIDWKERDHLFISYAWEDSALADWLVRKLTAAGYRVWCDRFKIIGGERWPRKIDKAIKEKAFRMLALLSKASLEKPNPVKERQLGFNLCKTLGVDFVIPLNVDGLRPEELEWQLSDVQWVPFQNWSAGFSQLLQTFAELNAPRTIATDGARFAIETFQPADVLTQGPDRAISNCFPIVRMPVVMKVFRASREVMTLESRTLWRSWPAYRLNGTTYASFWEPAAHGLVDCEWSEVRKVAWRDVPRIDEVNTGHIAKNLVRQVIAYHCNARGLISEDTGGDFYFPPNLLPKNRLVHTSYTGRRVPVQTIGEKKFGKGRLRYQLGVAFWLRDDVIEGLAVEMKLRLRMSDPAEPNVEAKAANAMRKKVAKGWWNHEWLSRQLAMTEFLSAGTSELTMTPTGADPIVVSAKPLETLLSPGIDDGELEKLKRQVRAMNAAESDTAEADTSEPGDPYGGEDE